MNKLQRNIYIGYPVVSGGKKYYPIIREGAFFAEPAAIVEYFETIKECEDFIAGLK